MKKNTDTWLVGVSAGPDSMALLQMCIEKEMSIEVAHVNYHHRKEADQEENYVRQFCRKYNIPLHVKNDPFISEGNFEADARIWRYDFFVQIVQQQHLKGVLIAHQQDDLIETYIMQEEKNLIPSYYGLAEEMLYKGMLVKRPLLSYTKQELEQYCKDRHVTYYVDCTNASDAYTRNRIRHSTVEKLTSFERKMIVEEIHRKNAEKKERICRVKTMYPEGKVSLLQYRALSREDREALLREFLETEEVAHRCSLAYLHEIDMILCHRNDFVIPFKEKEIVQDSGLFFVIEPSDSFEDVYYTKQELEDIVTSHYQIKLGEKGIYAVTLQEEDFPVTIRSVKEGDKIQMRFGTKSVHRFFIDRHIPLYKRENYPVVCDKNGNVILVPGLGCDVAHFNVKPDFNVVL